LLLTVDFFYNLTKFTLRRSNIIKYILFEKAKVFVNALNLKNKYAWEKYCEGTLNLIPVKPSNIPDSPGRCYKNKGWTNWADWLGIQEKTEKNKRKRYL